MNRDSHYRNFFVSMSLALCCAAWAIAAEPPSFYESKTVTMIISTSPGGATDVAGRLVSRYLGKYLPGHPNIIAQNMPGAGGIVAANYLSNIVKPDGLTLLAVNRANYLEQMVGRPEVKLDFWQTQLGRQFQPSADDDRLSSRHTLFQRRCHALS